MDRPMCPHCNSGELAVAKMHRDVVVVMPCPQCSGLVVMFRRKALALDRAILERGTKQERKMHIAGIIAEFLEPGLLRFATASGELEPAPGGSDASAEAESAASAAPSPISDEEMREFTRVDLRRLDDRDYFKRYFG